MNGGPNASCDNVIVGIKEGLIKRGFKSVGGSEGRLTDGGNAVASLDILVGSESSVVYIDVEGGDGV